LNTETGDISRIGIFALGRTPPLPTVVAGRAGGGRCGAGLGPLAAAEGEWRVALMLADPHQLAEPLTGVRGHLGTWLLDRPPCWPRSAGSAGSGPAMKARPPGAR